MQWQADIACYLEIFRATVLINTGGPPSADPKRSATLTSTPDQWRSLNVLDINPPK